MWCAKLSFVLYKWSINQKGQKTVLCHPWHNFTLVNLCANNGSFIHHLGTFVHLVVDRTACTLSTKYKPKQFSTKLKHTHHHSLHPPSCCAPCEHADSQWKFLPALPVVQACVTYTVDTTTPTQDSDDCRKSSYDDPSLKPGTFTTYLVGGWIDGCPLSFTSILFSIHCYPSAFTATLQYSLLQFSFHCYHSAFTTTLHHPLLSFVINSLLPFSILYNPSVFTNIFNIHDLPFSIHYYRSSFTTTLQLSPCSSL